jgi:DNA glycosylase AlkZ-like
VADGSGHALLERQLLHRSAHRVEQVVDALAGMNAQTPRGPSVGLWSRIDGFRQESVDECLRDYRLVKANLMRGTVHLVTASQFRTWRAALQPALRRTVRQFCPSLHHDVDVEAVVGKGMELLAGVDHGMTRADLARRLASSFDADPRHCAFAVRLLAPVVQVADPSVWRPGPTRYVLAESVLGALDPPDEDDEAGLADLLTAYLRAFGPATAADATYWSGRTRLAAPLADLTGVSRSGRGAAATFDVNDPESRHPRASFVLPEYDNIFFAHKENAFTVAKKRLIYTRTAHMYGSVLVDGRVVAAWRREAGSDDLTLLPWTDPVPDQAIAEFAALRTFYASA